MVTSNRRIKPASSIGSIRIAPILLLTGLLGVAGGSQVAMGQSLAPGDANCTAARAAFEATLPVPAPKPGRYAVQLVNESPATLLTGANAAHVAGQPPSPVLPREGTNGFRPIFRE